MASRGSAEGRVSAFNVLAASATCRRLLINVFFLAHGARIRSLTRNSFKRTDLVIIPRSRQNLKFGWADYTKIVWDQIAKRGTFRGDFVAWEAGKGDGEF
jgi:hypothetical protein